MPPELLAAMLQAEHSEPSVRSAALLRIARVLAKADQGEAERLLDRGLALLAELPEEERAAIAPQAMCLAACVAPDRAFALRATTSDAVGNEKFLFDMVRHGHVAAAVDYLTQWSEDGEFPYHAAFETISCTKDNDARRDILRSGLRACHRRADSTWHSFDSLLQLFRFHADAQKVIDDTRDTTFRKGPDVDVKAAWAAAAKQINDIEAKASA